MLKWGIQHDFKSKNVTYFGFKTQQCVKTQQQMCYPALIHTNAPPILKKNLGTRLVLNEKLHKRIQFTYSLI